LSNRSILVFWAPLAATWLMMALEGPFLAAVIARLVDPKFNLAAHGVAFAFAILVEAPVMMLMSAATTLVEDSASYRKLRNFANAVNAGSTALLLLVLIPPVFGWLMQSAIGLPDEVAGLTYGALWLFLPWPAAIGVRRFLQGVLIRSGRTRLVALGTVVRLVVMTSTALALYFFSDLPGAWVGAATLSTGVLVEMAVTRWMASPTLREILARQPRSTRRPGLSYRWIAHFYFPLAVTSVISLTVQPMLTFFMGRAVSPVESLAVFPVVQSLGFIFRALGLSFQDAALALVGERNEHFRELGRFAVGLSLASAAGLAVIAFSPLARVWFETVSGLTTELATLAIPPTRILVALPALSVFLSLQRALLIQNHRTRPITVASAVEFVGIGLTFVLAGWVLGMVGVTAAILAFLVGRLASTVYLVPLCVSVLRVGDDI
jgi:Na+-driven multidrug efflux pump